MSKRDHVPKYIVCSFLISNGISKKLFKAAERLLLPRRLNSDNNLVSQVVDK